MGETIDSSALAEGESWRSPLGRQVRDALLHLYDLPYLQTHPLTSYLPRDAPVLAAYRGQALQQVLLAAIQSLAPNPGPEAHQRATRTFQVLRLRYVEGLEIAAVSQQLGIRATEYHRAHRRALEAVVGILAQRWQRSGARTGDGSAEPVSAPAALAARPEPEPPHLPVALTRFVGRERDLAELTGRLRDPAGPRLITLTGPAGSGKSRLALQVAQAVADAYPHGLWLVDLGMLADRQPIAGAIAAALHLAEAPAESPVSALIRFLENRRALLILDHCGGADDESAHTIASLLARCPRLTILTTSQEIMRIGGELNWRVSSLALPPPLDQEPGKDLATLAESPAVRLFLERAQAVQPAFVLTSSNAAAVVEICRRLDGLPLAIELAASQLRVLDVTEIAARLDDPFRLLTGGSRSARPRHRTLRGLIDGSYATLSPLEQRLFGRLACFTGPWSLAAAEGICAGDAIASDQVLPGLTGLVDRSLVQAEAGDGGKRYRLLETIRQYAGEKLAATGEAAVMQRRHRDWYLAFIEQATGELTRQNQLAWLRRVDEAYDNLRLALEGAQNDPSGAEAELRLAGALGPYWYLRSRGKEGRAWLRQALARVDRAPIRSRALALTWAARLAVTQGELTEARALADEALPLARGIDDPALLVLALRHAGLAAGAAGDGERERAATEEALAVAVQHGAVGELAETLVALGRLTLSEGDRDRTRRLLETALGYARQSGDRALMSGVLRQLGILACSQEDYPAARGNLEESLALARAIDFPAFIVFSLAHLAQLARRTGNHERASALARCALATAQRAGGSAILASAVRAYISVRVGQGGDSGVVRLAAAEAAWRASRPFLLASEQAQQEQDLAHLRATVAPATFEAEWTAGSSLTLEQSVAVTLADGG